MNCCPEVIAFFQSGARDAVLEWRARAGPRRDCAQFGISAAPLRLRLVRVKMPGGTIEVLATNLLDAETSSARLFKDLYQQR